MSDTTTNHRSIYTLAILARCADPNSADSPGGRFLRRVETATLETVEDDQDVDDARHEIADGAVPVHTHDRWQTFVDLAAYNEDLEELAGTSGDMTANAGFALYLIAERLAGTLLATLDTLTRRRSLGAERNAMPTHGSTNDTSKQIAQDDIIGYVYRSDIYCPLHIGALLATGDGEAFDGWALSPGVPPMSAEANLNEIADAFGVNRQDETTYTADYFPKVIVRDQGENHVCGTCGDALAGTHGS